MIRESTPRPCCACDLCRPLWFPIWGLPLPGERCKCIRLGGICSKVQPRMEPTVKTPAQVEKALEKAKIELDLSDLIYKPKAAAIAPVNDKRPTFVPSSAEEMFDAVDDGEEEE